MPIVTFENLSESNNTQILKIIEKDNIVPLGITFFQALIYDANIFCLSLFIHA